MSARRGFVLLPVVLVLAVLATLALALGRQGSMTASAVGAAAAVDRAGYLAEAGLQHATWLASTQGCSAYGLPSTPLGQGTYTATFTPTAGSPVDIVATGTLPDGTSRRAMRDAVPVYEPTVQTLVLQPGPGVGADTWIRLDHPTWNYGAHNVLQPEEAGSQRGLIAFDLSSLGAGWHIRAARLELHAISAPVGGRLEATPVLAPWTEGDCPGNAGCPPDGATWLSSDGVTAWADAGGDHDAATVVSTAGLGPGAWHVLDVTDLVLAWRGGALANHGLLLRGVGGAFTIATSEWSVAELRPRLVVEFSCECGTVCAPPPTCDARYTPTARVDRFATVSGGDGHVAGLTAVPAGFVLGAATAPAGGAWVTVDPSEPVLAMYGRDGSLLGATVPAPAGDLAGVTYVAGGLHQGRLAIARSNLLLDDVAIVDPGDGSVVTTIALTGLVTDPAGITYIGVTASAVHDGELAVADGAASSVVYLTQQGGPRGVAYLGFGVAPAGLAHVAEQDAFLVADAASAHGRVVDFVGATLHDYPLAHFGAIGAPTAVAIDPLTCDHVHGIAGAGEYLVLNEPPGATSVTVSAVADTYVDASDPSAPPADDAELVVANSNGGARRRALLRFDAAAAVPAGAFVTRATLRVYQFGHSGAPIDVGVHAMVESWDEATATWEEASAGTAWTGGPGAGLDPLVLGTTTLPNADGWYAWDVTALVQEWVDGVSVEHGLALEHESGGGSPRARIDSREGTAGQHPELVIEYVPL